MAKNLTHTVGLDVGTSRVTCIIGEPGDGGLVEVVGIGESEAKGLRKGVVVDPEAAVESITRAVEEAERMSGLEAEEVAINHSVGMIGARLAVKVHIVTSPVTARQNVINAVNRAGLVVGEMVLEQLAAAEATLTDDDKEFGAALVDVGAETTGLIIYQRGAVQHTAVFALGGSHFTIYIVFVLGAHIPVAH